MECMLVMIVLVVFGIGYLVIAGLIAIFRVKSLTKEVESLTKRLSKVEHDQRLQSDALCRMNRDVSDQQDEGMEAHEVVADVPTEEGEADRDKTVDEDGGLTGRVMGMGGLVEEMAEVRRAERKREAMAQEEAEAEAEEAVEVEAEHVTPDEVEVVHEAAVVADDAVIEAASNTRIDAEVDQTGGARESGLEKLRRTFEEQFGAHLYYWIGAIAIIMSGGLGVHYTIQEGLLTPMMRVVGGGVLGVCLTVAGLLMKQKSERLANACCGAGVSVMYTTLLIAHSVFELIGGGMCFGLMAMVTVIAVVLSLWIGMPVAMLGLLGGFATPMLSGAADQSQEMLFGYLLLLEIGLMVVAQRKGWFGVSLLTLVCSMAWPLVRMVFGDVAGSGLVLGGYMVLSFMVYVVGAVRTMEKPTGWRLVRMSISAGLASCALMGLLVLKIDFSLMSLGMVLLLGAGMVVVGRFDDRQRMLGAAGLVLSVLMMAAWMLSEWGGGKSAQWEYLLIIAGMGLIYWVGGFVCGWWGKRRVYWSVISGVGGVACFILSLMSGVDAMGMPWWIAGSAMGVAGCMGVYLVIRHLGEMAMDDVAVGFHATCAAALLLLAAGVGASSPWQAVWWAGLLAAAVWTAGRFGRPVLRVTVQVIYGVMIMGALVGISSAESQLAGGMHVVLNELAGFWVGLVSLLGLSGWLYAQRNEEKYSGQMQGSAMLFLLFGVLMVVHRAFTGYALRDLLDATMVEVGTFAVVVGTLGMGLVLAKRRWLGWCYLAERGGVVYAYLCGLALILSALTVANPLMETRGVMGAGFVGGLWYVGVFGVVMLVLLGNWWLMGERAAKLAKQGVLVMVMILGGLLGGMLVRQGFTDGVMLLRKMSVGLFEGATYGVVWMAMSLAMVEAVRRWQWRDEVLKNGAVALGVIGLTAAIGFACLKLNPLWHEHDIGGLVVLNGLLYVYGLPMVLAMVLRWRVDERVVKSGDVLGQGFGVCGLVLGFVWMMLTVRHGFTDGEMLLRGPRVGLVECATYGVVLLTAGLLMMLATGRGIVRDVVIEMGGRVFGVMGAGVILFGCVLGLNPLWHHGDVGQMWVLNMLLYVYLLPAALVFGVAKMLRGAARTRGIDWRWLANVLGLFGLVLVFGWISLAVRQGFVGGVLDLDVAGVSQAEWYAYSAAWIVFGVLLLVCGIVWRAQVLRYASLAVMLLSVCKVFLFDLRHLEGLLQVGSFLGLGLTLIVLGLVYQKLVFSSNNGRGEDGLMAEEEVGRNMLG
ncbi:DUF2339 domain-containing protein [Poriferisphaera sp. WC338]|uniref:DUF2339 domain-containing protein n=1 Tax=Poriferisphaera sp. WC338 TaxID=3425129 RepID=UPI003D8199B5